MTKEQLLTGGDLIEKIDYLSGYQDGVENAFHGLDGKQYPYLCLKIIIKQKYPNSGGTTFSDIDIDFNENQKLADEIINYISKQILDKKQSLEKELEAL
jgi:hypothetical protein